MTVRILNEHQKNAVKYAFTGPKDIKVMAQYYGVSRRTIIRVLEEASIDPGIRRRKPKQKPVITEQYPLPVGDPITLPKFTWGQRALSRIARALGIAKHA